MARESEQPQPPQVPPTTKGAETAAAAAAALDDESFVRDRYYEDVTAAIEMEADGKKGGRRKYRQESRYRILVHT